MESFKKLYDKLVEVSVNNSLEKDIEKLKETSKEHHLDCLLKPEMQPPVIRLGKCICNDEEKEHCECICSFDAITCDEDNNIVISKDNCVGCNLCIDSCKHGNLVDRKDLVPMFELLHSYTIPVYALIAPAYISQFSKEVTPGKLRTAFKLLGFEGMIEVALFADILTLKEALEFDSTINNEDDFLLTSCCCPIWIGRIKKVYHSLMTHLPPSVSPMVACGRSIKKLYPDAKTVFIGPCIAKKAEAKQKDIADAVDYVVTFQEMKQIFDTAKIVPSQLEEDLRDHSSTAGRTYARTAGVSEAVQNTLNKLKPKRAIPLRAQQADGISECKVLLKKIQDGNVDANFIEGMGCVGGCVGGPKSIIDKDDATIFVNDYGKEATYNTPVDNPFVLEMLHRLGFDTIESLLQGENMFTRDFNSK